VAHIAPRVAELAAFGIHDPQPGCGPGSLSTGSDRTPARLEVLCRSRAVCVAVRVGHALPAAYLVGGQAYNLCSGRASERHVQA
jgi:hypothetical protein